MVISELVRFILIPFIIFEEYMGLQTIMKGYGYTTSYGMGN